MLLSGEEQRVFHNVTAGHTLGTGSIDFAGVGDVIEANQRGSTAVTVRRSVH